MIAETISMAPYEVSFPSKIDILVRKWVSKFWEGIPRGGGGAEKKKLSAVCAAAAGADSFSKKKVKTKPESASELLPDVPRPELRGCT